MTASHAIHAIDPPDVTVLKLLGRGRAPDWVAQATGRDRADIEAVGVRHGWPDRAAMRRALAAAAAPEVAPPNPAPTARTAPTGRPNRLTARPVGGPRSVPGQIEMLLARAGEHDHVAVRRAHDRVLAACGRLHATLRDVETRQREQQAKRAAWAEAKARVSTLEGELRAAKSVLRAAAAEGAGTPTPPGGGTPGPGPGPIRTWAAAHGVDCPRVGRVPARVLDAYLAAHQAPDKRTA